MLRIELEKGEGRYRVWSEEHGYYVLRQSTQHAVMNFYRQQAIMRADSASLQFLEEAKSAGVCPLRRPKVVV